MLPRPREVARDLLAVAALCTAAHQDHAAAGLIALAVELLAMGGFGLAGINSAAPPSVGDGGATTPSMGSFGINYRVH